MGPTGSASTLCQAIAEALKINRTIKSIFLGSNNIGVPGAEAWPRATGGSNLWRPHLEV